MLRGVLTRAAVAVFLIGILVAPFGTCLTMHQKAAHNCCMPATDSSCDVQPDCCIANAPLPAAILTPALPDATPLAVVQELVPVDELTVLRDFISAKLHPPQSPPVGAFHLRI